MIRDHTITPLQAQLILNNIFTLYPHLGQKEKIKLIDSTKSVLTKSEMARILVAIFQLEKNKTNNVFRDISNHNYQDAITKLAQLGGSSLEEMAISTLIMTRSVQTESL